MTDPKPTGLAALRKAAEGKYALDDGDLWEIGQAADEIERLRVDVDFLRSKLVTQVMATTDLHHRVIDLRAQKDALLLENKRLRAAILWALGVGDSDFGDRKPANPGPFWWRSELKERAGL